jgi:CDP-diacylglycerol--glycerol-3-phosphate 3-phosphatidyltransferase
VANALSGLRLLLAVVFPVLLVRGGAGPLVVWIVAALSDYVDGPIARRRGAVSTRGAVLDVVADVAFVLGGLATAAASGLVTWIAPASIVGSVGGYVLASIRMSRHDGPPRLARSRIGHWAGVVNWACVGVVTGALALPSLIGPRLLDVAGAATAAINLAAVGSRLIGR